MAKTTIFEYKGDEQTVTWDRRLCIHVGECGRAKGDLFVTGRDPWCDPNLSNEDQTRSHCREMPDGSTGGSGAAMANTLRNRASPGRQ